MSHYLDTLSSEFELNRNTSIAEKQKAYMRGQFEYFGIKTTERRLIQKPFLSKDFLPKKEDLNDIIIDLWNRPERDFQLFGQELILKYIKQLNRKDIELLEYIITHKSWWDTVDFIAYKLIGTYFEIYPEEKLIYVQKWLDSEHLWLQRTAVLFQLKYKDAMDTKILSHCIHSLNGTKEFFINKAIGWVLREYTRTNSEWVIEFVKNNELSNLSKKEALRLLK